MTDPQVTSGGNIGPWIISGLALIQVWVIALYKKYFRRPHVSMYESGNIEIGYSNLGPTIGLIGTLRTVHQDVFVKRITLELVKVKDGSKHDFNWRAFRSNTISLNPAEPLQLEIASSFLLSASGPFKFNIVFTDDSFIADISPKVADVTKTWVEYRRKKLKDIETELGEKYRELAGNPQLDQFIFDQTAKDRLLLDPYTTLDRAFYWEAGRYKLQVNIQCEGPNRTFSKNYAFTLSEDDERLLRLNTVTILRTLCGFSDTPHFAYRKYEET